MSHTSSSPSLDDLEADGTLITVHLTYHRPKLNQNGKPSKATAKDEKQKELLFVLQEDSYVAFLQAILKLFNEDKYQVAHDKPYRFKYSRSGSKSGALDVECEDEYRDLVSKFEESNIKAGTRPHVYVDMANVQAVCSVLQPPAHDAVTANVNSGVITERELPQATGLEVQLARIRLLLEKEWKNENDELVYKHVDANGRTIEVPLTPFMVKEWARAIYDGVATKREPPNSAVFDPKKARVSLRDIPATTPAASTTSPDAFGAAINLFGNIFDRIAPPASFACPPKTPQKKRPTTAPTTPLRPPPSPEDLHRFLDWAESSRGIHNALSYESPLRHKDLGPDILSHIPNDTLMASDIGISLGNAIRLKEASRAWYALSESMGGKRKHAADEAAELGAGSSKSRRTNDDYWVRYERRHPNGAESWTDPPPIAGEHKPEDDNVSYYDDVLGKLVPLPMGMTAHPTDEERSAVTA
ncbi:hypothetical protein EIP86_006324 [Pleurotus ostreatoroseus]|nr:hypothetical protein EIP86_006324 [Pleurotus ostreatoroseus]